MSITGIYKTYLLPAFVIQSVILAGGFGTGREIVEYFTSHGALGGLLGLVLAFVLYSIVIGLTFDIAQKFSSYNYQDFFTLLIGRYSIIFEVVYLLTLILVMSIVGSAAGTLLEQSFSIPYYVGILGLYVIVCILSCFGVEFVNRFLTFSTIFVYAVLITTIAYIYSESSDAILKNLGNNDIKSTWTLSSAKFALYTLSPIPALLFATRAIDTSKKARVAGCIVAAIIIFPGILIHLILLAGYPEVNSQQLPIFWIINKGGHHFIITVYILMLICTLCATASGLIQGLIERISTLLVTKGLGETTPLKSVSISIGVILMSLGLSTVGFVELVAKGYSILAYCILFVYVLPLLIRSRKLLMRGNQRI